MLFRNRWNGTLWESSSWLSPEGRTLWLFKKRIQDFDRLRDGLELHTSFLTITQSDVSVDSGYRWISGVMDSMRHVFKRRGLLEYYVAALEIQPKRYRKYGVLAPHWHIAIAHSLEDALPHARRDQETGRIRKERNGSVITWDWLHQNIKQKFGMYFCCDCWSRNVLDYLGKYLAKEELLKDFKERLGRRVRVFASSRFPVEYQMSWIQEMDYRKLVEESPDMADWFWRREGSSIVARGKEIVEGVSFDGWPIEKVRYPRVYKIAGEWVRCEGSSTASPNEENGGSD